MKLTKTIPAHKKTLSINWCEKNFMEMDQGYRITRANMRNKMDTCYWCKHPFTDGEMIALAGTKQGNKVLCQECALAIDDKVNV